MDKISRALPGTPLQHAKATGSTEDPSAQSGRRKKNEHGLVGLVNTGNSCYMNATLQALSNCSPFRQYFIDCHHPGSSHNRAADALSTLFRQMWTSERHPGHLSPRKVSSVMKNKTFRGSLQQDAQEYLRCLLSQIHDEIGLVIPEGMVCGCGSRSCDCNHRDSSISCVSHDSNGSNDSNSKLVRSASESPVTPKRKTSASPTFSFMRKGSYSKLRWGSKNSLESAQHLEGTGKEAGLVTKEGVASEETVQWEVGDVFVADLDTGVVSLASSRRDRGSLETSSEQPLQTELTNQIEPVVEVKGQIGTKSEPAVEGKGQTNTEPMPVVEVETEMETVVEFKGQGEATPTSEDGICVDANPGGVVLREKQAKKTKERRRRVVSIVSQVFEGVLESKVTCSYCKKVSVTHEPFHDLSLPIPGRKEMAKFSRKPAESDDSDQSDERENEGNKMSSSFCSVLNIVRTLARDLTLGPPTDIQDCLNGFFDACELKGDNKYYCCHCKSFQNSKKQMSVLRLPEVLCIHLKRFRFDAFFSSKISRHITFPMSGLDMSGYLRDKKGPRPEKYALDALITHIGGAGGGHYIAYARNALSNTWHEFNDTRVHSVSPDTVQGAEGYVLFYRRVPPTGAMSAQPLDITTLLPKRGTTLPSPDVCYLSRHWLHLAKHCAHPGPIFQHEYACNHGHVVCTDSLARQASMAVRREVWEQLQRKYGGGPLVLNLDPCRECQDEDMFTCCPYNLEQLTAKRAKEKGKVHQIQQSERAGKTEPYLLSKNWLQQWQSFIQCNSLDVLPPGPIDNTLLLTVGGADHTHKLTDSGSYRKLSHSTWSYLYQTYGGGPLITTSLGALTPVESTV